MIALMLCTGTREQELVSFNVDDLRQTLGGKLALIYEKAKVVSSALFPIAI
jgi:hypothetical protein